MKRKLISFFLLVVAFCLIVTSVSANAQINHNKQTTSTETESNTILDLDSKYYPYTKAEVTLTLTGTSSYMYNQVTDAKGNLHINGKAFVKGIVCIEAWVWDDARQIWILGQKSSQSDKQFFGYNELFFDSEIKTSKETRLSTYRSSAYLLDLDSGETITLDILIIEHVIVKLNNEELQFEKYLEISRGTSDL